MKADHRLSQSGPIDEAEWDTFVRNHPFGWITHLPSWKRVIERSFPHIRGHCLTLKAEPTGHLQAALPVFEVRSWLTGDRLISIPFATISDPLISSQDEFGRLMQRAKDLASELRIGSIEIRTLNSGPLISDQELQRTDQFVFHYLPLDRPIEEIYSTFHPTSVRQRIRRAERSGLKMATETDRGNLRTFYDLYLISRRKLGLPPHPPIFFNSLWDEFSPKGQMEILHARKDGQALSSVILFKFGNRVSIEYTAWDEKNRNESPIQFLYWEVIKKAHAEGYKVLDLGRTSSENTGLLEFKNRWGTSISPMPQFFYSLTGKAVRSRNEGSFAYRSMTRIVGRMPLKMLPFLGKLSYRHLG